MSMWSVAGLSGFHSLLIAQEISTNEDVSFKHFSVFWSKQLQKLNVDDFFKFDIYQIANVALIFVQILHGEGCLSIILSNILGIILLSQSAVGCV